ncbi:MAG TPA: DUF6036 family nucleotidyltransferase [Polyangiaceae bacterium]
MRASTDAAKVERFMEELGRLARSSGRVYLVGGATAVLHGWRTTTVDIDLKMDPEPAGAFEAIAELKDALDVNIELAAPDQFIPPLPNWQARSPFIARHGSIDFLHYDLTSQALAKIERGHARDLDDVRAMVERALVALDTLLDRFAELRPGLARYPALDANAFEDKVRAFVETEGKE